MVYLYSEKMGVQLTYCVNESHDLQSENKRMSRKVNSQTKWLNKQSFIEGLIFFITSVS